MLLCVKFVFAEMLQQTPSDNEIELHVEKIAASMFVLKRDIFIVCLSRFLCLVQQYASLATHQEAYNT